MRVLKKGRSQTGWSIKARCTGSGNGDGGCGASLLIEQPDVYRTESHARDETTAYATFQCPECGVLTDIPERKVPSHVWDAMIYRGPNDWPLLSGSSPTSRRPS